MRCIQCKASELENRMAEIPIKVKGEMFSVEMQAIVCPGCGYQTSDGSRMAEYMRAGADMYRVKHNRLTSSDIRTRRRSWLGMNQLEFAAYLPVSPVSVKRWELGQVQDEAMDELIRIKTDAEAARENYHRVALMNGVALAGIIEQPTESEWQPHRKQYEIVIKDWEEQLSAA